MNALGLEILLGLLQLDQLLFARASAGVFVEVEQHVALAPEAGEVDGLAGGGRECNRWRGRAFRECGRVRGPRTPASPAAPYGHGHDRDCGGQESGRDGELGPGQAAPPRARR